MAMAVENTIPCDRCNTQIDLRDWSQHIRNCLDSRNNQIVQEKKNPINDRSNDERFPCEYCYAQISTNDWASHTKICAERNVPPKQDYTNSTRDELAEATVPCEYCYVQVNIYELERHTRQCAANQRSQPKPPVRDEPAFIPCEYCQKQIIANDWETHTRRCVSDQKPDNYRTKNDEPVLIPCEYCEAPIDVNEWERHTKKCAEEDKKRIENEAKRISKAKDQSNVILPCDFCAQFFPMDKITEHERKCRYPQPVASPRPNTPTNLPIDTNFTLPEHWEASAPRNLTRYVLDPGSEEYRFVADNFHKTLPTNQITQIDRIQNRRWYRQYDAHKDDFIERYGNSTEQWLFHGCRRGESAEAIIRDCFNRSHAVNCAVGQGIYFATQAATSLGYTSPDPQRLRHMFMARVLVGKTTRGDRSTRVCPPGYDTTGGNGVYVTYHDAQAYAQYLIVFR